MMLMVKAMQLKVGNPLRKLVLIKLADNANDLGECWPSYQHIADQCEISRSSVKNHIRELEKSGFVTRVFRKNGALNQSNIFRLNLNQSSGAGNTPVGQELPPEPVTLLNQSMNRLKTTTQKRRSRLVRRVRKYHSKRLLTCSTRYFLSCLLWS